jgi:hypothetical protein
MATADASPHLGQDHHDTPHLEYSFPKAAKAELTFFEPFSAASARHCHAKSASPRVSWGLTAPGARSMSPRSPRRRREPPHDQRAAVRQARWAQGTASLARGRRAESRAAGSLPDDSGYPLTCFGGISLRDQLVSVAHLVRSQALADAQWCHSLRSYPTRKSAGRSRNTCHADVKLYLRRGGCRGRDRR